MTNDEKAEIAILATQYHLPLSQFLDATRWLLKIDCPYCQVGTQILKRTKELGGARTKHLILRVLEAKKTNNIEELEAIRNDNFKS